MASVRKVPRVIEKLFGAFVVRLAMHSLDSNLVHELRTSRFQLSLQIEICEALGRLQAFSDHVDQKPRILCTPRCSPILPTN